MNLKHRKELIARTFYVGKKRIMFNTEKLQDIKKAITKSDIRSLVAEGAIIIVNKKGQSHSRSKKIKLQKSKGRRKSIGSRKGKKYSRLSKKRRWILHVRTQRNFVKKLRNRHRISKRTFRNLYSMIKSNRFRNIRLIKTYLEKNSLFLKE